MNEKSLAVKDTFYSDIKHCSTHNASSSFCFFLRFLSSSIPFIIRTISGMDNVKAIIHLGNWNGRVFQIVGVGIFSKISAKSGTSIFPFLFFFCIFCSLLPKTCSCNVHYDKLTEQFIFLITFEQSSLRTYVYLFSKYAAHETTYCPTVISRNKIIPNSRSPIFRTWR